MRKDFSLLKRDKDDTASRNDTKQNKDGKRKGKSTLAESTYKRQKESKKNRSGSEIVCYRCGVAGHIKPNCTLKEDDPRVIAQKNKNLKRNLKRLQADLSDGNALESEESDRNSSVYEYSGDEQ